MRRTLTLGLGLLAGALMVVPVASALGAAAGARSAADKTFTVFQFGRNPLIPAPGANSHKAHQPVQGDVIVINGHLTLPFAEDGKFKIIGHDTGTCTLTRVGRHGGALANCTVTAVLPHGSIATEGQLKFARRTFALKTSHLAITGGTGEFRGAGGALQVVAGRRHDALTFTVR
jgi:hypothetical protein